RRRTRHQRPPSAGRPRGPRRDHARTAADAPVPRPQRPTGSDSRQRRWHHRRREAARADLAEVLRRTRQLVTGPYVPAKSTLLSVPAADLCPPTGRVRRSAGTRIAHLRQESALPLDRRASELFASHQDALIAAGVFPSSQAVGLSSLGL